MSKFGYLISCLVLIFSTGVFSYDNPVELLANNKEPVSASLSLDDKEDVYERFGLDEREEIVDIFKTSIGGYFYRLGRDADSPLQADSLLANFCDMSFLAAFERRLDYYGYSLSPEAMRDYFKILRGYNAIDDILYDILLVLNDQKRGLEKAAVRRSRPWFLDRYSDKEVLLDADMTLVFEDFKPLRKGEDSCFYSSYSKAIGKIARSLNKNRPGGKDLKMFNFEALNRGAIDEPAFWQLEFMRKNSDYFRSSLPLGRYLFTLLRVKDKMRPHSYDSEVVNIELENKFVAERLSRWKKISRRKLLYRKYNPTQITMLAEVMEKASRRMGVDPDVESSAPVIVQKFSVLNSDGTRSNYVERYELDSQSQYNYARRRMRQDIIDLQNMDAFAGTRIDYSEIVSAALETGYITHEDISYVLEYDDLWNPKTDPWRRLKRFCYSIGRASILYLPPPMNIVGTVGLTAVQAFMYDNNKKGKYNDNPATLIE